MKWLVSAAALAVGIASLAIRTPAADRSMNPNRQVAVAGRITPPHKVLDSGISELSNPALPRQVDPKPPTQLSTSTLRDAEPSEADSLNSQEEVRSRREQTLQVLKERLDLSPTQCGEIEGILCDRDSEIQKYHSQIRASKIFWVWEHEKRAREILAVAHQRILGILSSGQAGTYERLIDEKKIVVGVSFEVTPDLVVIR